MNAEWVLEKYKLKCEWNDSEELVHGCFRS